MTEKEIDDYFDFVDSKLEILNKRIDAYCLSINATRNELIKFHMEKAKLTNEILKTLNKDNFHDAVRSIQGNERFELGNCCHLYLCLKGQIKNKNLIETFKLYSLLISELESINNRRINEYEKSNSMRKYAKLRLANDPKQKALDEIKSHYEAAKHQFRRRGYTAKFVKEMAEIYPIIESQKTIENLVTALNKENELIPR